MKRTIFFFLMLLGVLGINAQGIFGIFPLGTAGLETDKYTVLDEAKYKFSYRLTCVIDTIENKTVVNNLLLLVGTKYSKFFNDYPPHPEIGSGNVNPDESRGLGGTEVYKGLKNKKLYVTTRIWMPRRDVFIYEEELPRQKWAFSSEIKRINGYKCQKATTRYLGRNYEAWYTLEIPISNGPWKLGGLPGMILEAYDTQRHYVFECIGIEKVKKKEEIVQYKWHYVKITRKEINKMIERMHRDFFAYLSTVSNGMYGGHSQPRPYNPLERE